MAKIKNPKTGETFEIDDTPESRQTAITKGYVPVVTVENPKTGDKFDINDSQSQQAIDKGFVVSKPPGIIDQATDAVIGAAKDVGGAALEGVVAVGEFIDRYTGAPTRKAIGEIVTKEGEEPSVQEAFTGFVEQFGEDPKKAPTGKELARRLEFSDEPVFDLPLIGGVSTRGMAGFGIDVLADPTNIIPVSLIAKTAAKGTKAVAKGSAKLAIQGSKAAAQLVPGVKKTNEFFSAATRGARASMDALFKPSVADDFKGLAEIANKNNIALDILPEAIEFGDTSLISRASRVQREGLQGEALLGKFQESLGNVRNALDEKLKVIGDGIIINRAEAGQVIREGFDEAAAKMFSGLDTTYNTIIKEYPGLKIEEKAFAALESKLSGLEKFAKGRVARGVTRTQRAQGAELLDAVEAIRSSNGSFKQTTEALRDVGEAAFLSKNKLTIDPPDIRKLQSLYGDISDALKDTVMRDVKDGASVVKVLNKSNEVMSEFFGDKSVIGKFIGDSKLAPERLFDSLVLNGDSKKLDALKRLIPEKNYQSLKGTLVDTLMKREIDGSFSFRKLSSSIRNKKDVLNKLFEPDELQEVLDLVRLGDRHGLAIMSTSGTGASNILKDIFTSIQQSVTNEAFIEGLKKKARAAAKEIPAGPVRQVAPGPRAFRLPSRNRFDFGAKGSQVISVQQQNER
jgi:hypothetical protein